MHEGIAHVLVLEVSTSAGSIVVSSKGRGFRLNKGSQNSKIEFLDSIMDPKILR